MTSKSTQHGSCFFTVWVLFESQYAHCFQMAPERQKHSKSTPFGRAVSASRARIRLESMLPAGILTSIPASPPADALTGRIAAIFAIIFATYHGVMRHRLQWSCRALAAARQQPNCRKHEGKIQTNSDDHIMFIKLFKTCYQEQT